MSVAAAQAGQPWSYDWNGFYLGVTAGGAWGQYDPRTAAAEGPNLDAATAADITAVGTQRIKPSGFVAGIEGGYNWQSGNLLLGVEGDLQAVHLNGATTSHSTTDTGVPFTITSYGNAEGLFTLRPRIGFVASNNWLFYATGGLALTQLQSDFSFISGRGGGGADQEAVVPEQAIESGRLNTTKAGYAIGGGVEAPLTDRLSLKADYLHVNFTNTAGAVTANIGGAANVAFAHSSDLTADIVRAGLNYRFGGPDVSPSSSPILPLKAPFWKATPPVNTDWEVEAGARSWFSTGVNGVGPLFNEPNNMHPLILASRLIYSGLDAVSGEAFARVDHSSGLFVKGNLGAGGIYNGHLNDEDFPGEDVYSNTQHNASGHIGYATIDLGYNLLRGSSAKVGAFVGYNYYNQAINTYGCAQLAGDEICSPPLRMSLLGLTENDQFNSLRLGLSSQVMLTDQLRLTADVAYVPWINYSGLDNHLLRQLLLPHASNSGNGVMLEGILDYYITPVWSIGIGGRYWAWNMNTGAIEFNFLTDPSDNSVQPERFNTERYGVFVQSSYHWGSPTPSAEGSALPTKAPPVVARGPMHWTGFYVGGYLGGGWSNARWSDPFPSTTMTTLLDEEVINVAGFGNHTHATGPLGGGQVGADWQTGPWVLGVQADASAANMRGENTCFSGLGGINCQHIVNALGTVAGRVGYALDRALVYARAGGAWTDTTYNLFGDTGVLRLGAGSTTLNTWGWVVGGGLEYALTDHWTAFVEYNHIGLPTTTVPFPTVADVNTENISVKQTVDLFKAGVNYKFDLASLRAIGANN